MSLLRTFLLPALLLCGTATFAQYAPQAPLAGNDAITGSDARITTWANGCTLQRGWLDIADTSLGKPTLGSEASVFGAPDANVLSLGDGGSATLTFPVTIRNGEGPDFAVFENGFADPQHPEMGYLEFAFVEVSSDGMHFSRFVSSCHIQDTLQSDNFTYSDARLVHNLAGKYVAGYGTPFDLEELKGAPGLDVNSISHIRLIDVVGSLNPAYGSTDGEGHVINDPYPSHYISGGFDLDAIAVLHANPVTSVTEHSFAASTTVYPNPASDKVWVTAPGGEALRYKLCDIYGRLLQQGSFRNKTGIALAGLSPGMYLLQLDNGKEKATWKLNKQ